MTTLTPNTGPLTQALARKKRSPLPMLLLVTGLLAAIAFAALGYLESQKTERAAVLTRDVPYGQQLTAEDVGVIELPLHRPAQLAGISDLAAIVGQYAARSLGANDLVQPGMLMAAPPTQPVYPNGEQLAPNMVPMPFSTSTIGPLSFRDRVNLGFSDPSGAPDICARAGGVAGLQPGSAAGGPAQPRPYACRLLSDVRVLYVDEVKGVAYLELSPYQAQTIWALQAAGLALWGERYGVASDALPPLVRLDLGQVNAADLSAPVPTPAPQAAPGLPGADGRLPGEPQP